MNDFKTRSDSEHGRRDARDAIDGRESSGPPYFCPSNEEVKDLGEAAWEERWLAAQEAFDYEAETQRRAAREGKSRRASAHGKAAEDA